MPSRACTSMAFFLTASKKTLGIFCVFYLHDGKNITNFDIVIGTCNRTSFRPILSVIILVIEQIGLLLCLLLILLITHMIVG